MQKYELVLKNEKAKSYRLIRFFVLLFNAGGMVWAIANSATAKERLWPIILLAGIVFFLVSTITDFATKKYSQDTLPRIGYVWCAIAWIRTDLWWIAFVILTFLLLDFLAYRKLIVKINKNEVAYPSVTITKIRWDELNNVILKDGLLTIDLKNNKLIQQPILNAGSDINEREFNDFCKWRLQAAN